MACSGQAALSARIPILVARLATQLAQFLRALSGFALDLPWIGPERPVEVALKVDRPAWMVRVVARIARFLGLSCGRCRVAPGIVVMVLAVFGVSMARWTMSRSLAISAISMSSRRTGVVIPGMAGAVSAVLAIGAVDQQFGPGRSGLRLMADQKQSGGCGGDLDVFHDSGPFLGFAFELP